MAQDFVVIAYGNGDVLREIFNAIAAAMGDSPYKTLLHMSILVAGVWAAFELVLKRNLLSSAKWIGLYFLAFYVMFLPKATIHIIDRVQQDSVYAVDNVPLGLGILASYTSVIGDSLTQMVEKTFSLPDDLRYSRTGMVMAANLVAAASTFQMTDPDVQESMQSFVTQCIFYDLLLNKYSAQDLLSTTNIWQFVSSHASPARAFMYHQTVTTCRDGIHFLNADWKRAMDEAGYRYAARLFPHSKNPKTELLKYLPLSYGYLTDLSESASNLLQQNMMANAVQNGLLGWTARTSAPAALQSYAFNKSQQQTRMGNRTVGDMAAYWLPLLKNIFEGMLYGSFIFIFLLLLFPFGLQVLRQYSYSLVWVQMWAPLYAILNLYMTFYAQQRSMGALAGMGLSLSTQSALAQVNADISSLAGYISMSVPLIAAGLVKGLSSVLTHVGQYVGGMAHSAAQSTAIETASGNISQGNTSVNTHALNNMTANHVDTAARVFSGGLMAQMPGGSTLSMTPDGSMVMNNQSAISNLGTTINLASAIRSSAMQQADASYSAALSHQVAYNQAISSAERDALELSRHQATSQGSGESFLTSKTVNDMQALNSLNQMNENISHSQNAGHTDSAAMGKNLNRQLSGGLSARTPGGTGFGGSLGVHVSGGKSMEESHQESQQVSFSSATSHSNQENYSHTRENVFRALQEGSYRATDEKGQRLLESASASLERAHQEQQLASAQFQQAETYRQIATMAEEKAVSINTNATQTFMKSLQDGGHSMRDIERVMVNRPEEAQAMADQFTHSKVGQYMQEFSQHQASSEHHIRTAHDEHREFLKTEQTENMLQSYDLPSHHSPQHKTTSSSTLDTLKPDTTYQHAKEKIQESARQNHISQANKISTKAVDEVKQFHHLKIKEIERSKQQNMESQEALSKTVGENQKNLEQAFNKNGD